MYREPGIKLDAGDKLILERLTRIEGLLQTSLTGKGNPSPSSSASPSTSNDTNMGREDVVTKVPAVVPTPGKTSLAGLGPWAHPAISISTMPKLHTTPALNLLQWPLIRNLVSGPYDPQNLLQLEMAREPLIMTSASALDLSNATTYIKAFFEYVNIWYACVNPHTWTRYYKRALACGCREGPESCVVLLVLALGSASHNGSLAFIPPGEEPPGFSYFVAAWSLLPSIMMRNSVSAAQCIVLASAYLFYLVRPLEAWTLLSNASMKLQLLFGNRNRVPLEWKELSVRLYWNTLLYESDLLAELDLPHSGIVHFEELVELPGDFEEFEDEDYDDDNQVVNDPNNLAGDGPEGGAELWYFLAEIALRRLLNRVSHMIYQKDSPPTLGSLGPIVSELDFQLSQWYDNLPRPVRFPLVHEPSSNPVQTVLRLRYYACRTIIYRPYILAVFENEQAGTDQVVKEYCQRCLDATLRQLENVTSHREGHLPYLWQGALSMVSQTLLIMGATMSPTLSSLLPLGLSVDRIISAVITEVESYAHLAPSLKLSAEIIRDAEKRWRMRLS